MWLTSSRSLPKCLSLLLLVLALVSGCEDGSSDRKKESPNPEPGSQPTEGEGKRVKMVDNVHLEIMPNGVRRVVLDTEVVLREGTLEQLLTRKEKKEHEAILAVDADARKIHEALLLTKAKEGTPVRWLPQYRAATGTTIKVWLRYKDAKGKTVTVPAQSWIRTGKTGKPLDVDWVFAGSQLVDNPLDPKGNKVYLANEGDVICVSNFESALLDLPVKSSKDDEERGYEAWTARIPPIGTKVTMILEPVIPAAAAKTKK